MLITTTPQVEGKNIFQYQGLVMGEAIIGTNICRDMIATMRDIIGGRSRAYKQALEKMRQAATEEMVIRAMAIKANAVMEVNIDYEVFGEDEMVMVSINETAELLSGEKPKKTSYSKIIPLLSLDVISPMLVMRTSQTTLKRHNNYSQKELRNDSI